jgi:hypothetical protein
VEQKDEIRQGGFLDCWHLGRFDPYASFVHV